MILDFDNEGDDLELLGSRMVESMLWNFWPRMMKDTPDERKFDLSVEVNGKRLEIPSPDEFAPVELFAKSLRLIRNGDTNRTRIIESQRPRAQLGKLACVEGLRTPRNSIDPNSTLFPDPARHIALMRPVELVVKYLEGESLPDERLEWGGVFMTSDEDEIEQAFADSEPPAHDDWVSDSLPKPAKIYVNVALRELRHFASEKGNIGQTSGTPSNSGPPLARVAGRLGAALEGVGGDGAMRRRTTPGNRVSRPSIAKASAPAFQGLDYENENIIAIFRTQVRQDSNRTGITLVLEAEISIEGSSIGQAGGIGQFPQIISVTNLGSGETVNSARVALNGEEGNFEIRVHMPSDCAVVVNAHIETG